MTDKTQKITDILNKVDETVEIGKVIAPPGAKTAVQAVDDAVEIGKAGIGIFARLKALWGKKKK